MPQYQSLADYGLEEGETMAEGNKSDASSTKESELSAEEGPKFLCHMVGRVGVDG